MALPRAMLYIAAGTAILKPTSYTMHASVKVTSEIVDYDCQFKLKGYDDKASTDGRSRRGKERGVLELEPDCTRFYYH
jgi:hypothetical protein